MALNIAIVEDSQENIDILLYHIERSPVPCNIVGIAKTMGEAKLLLTRPDIELAFLDIQLKEGTVFDVLEETIRKGRLKFDTVFVTAHGTFENAMKGIQYACLEFINKPLDSDELFRAISKASDKRKDSVGQEEQLKYLLTMIGSQNKFPEKVGVILSKGIIQFIPVAEIEYFEADQTICRIFLSDQSKKVSAKHLGYYVQMLKEHPHFIQSSKSHLINLKLIDQYDHRERTVKFCSGSHVIASHRQSSELKKAILDSQKGNFLKGTWDKLSGLFD